MYAKQRGPVKIVRVTRFMKSSLGVFHLGSSNKETALTIHAWAEPKPKPWELRGDTMYGVLKTKAISCSRTFIMKPLLYPATDTQLGHDPKEAFL